MDEVKRLDIHKLYDFATVVLSQADAALLQAVVDAARKRDHHELSCAALEILNKGTIDAQRAACDCGFHETIDAIEKLDARLAEKERK